MIIEAWALLAKDDIVFDPETRTVSAKKDGMRYFRPEPGEERRGYRYYRFEGEVPDGSVFEVRGDNDQTEGRGGTYVAGYFSSYPVAYKAAQGLGVMGTAGYISVAPAPAKVWDDHSQWKAQFSSRNPAAETRHIHLEQVLRLAPNDTAAMSVANPEYVAYLELRAKFEPETV